MFRHSFTTLITLLSLVSTQISASAIPKQHDHPASQLQARAAKLPAGWEDMGCAADTNPRLLTGYSFNAVGKMTPSLCASTCQSKGFTYAATEFFYECYCGSAISPKSSTQCNTPCDGDKSQMCGGSWTMNLYRYTETVRPATKQAVAAASSAGVVTVYVTVTETVKAAASTTTVKAPASTTTVWATATINNAQKIVVTSSTPSSSSARPITSSTPSSSSTKPITTSSPSPSTVKPTSSSPSSYTVRPTTSTPSSSGKPTTSSPLPSSSSPSPSSSPKPTTSSPAAAISTSKPVSSSSAVATTSTSGNAPAASSTALAWPAIKSSGGEKKVWAHHMVGNTYPYTYATWVNDMTLAKSAGIDGFALNLGSDEWQPARIADAYKAAQDNNFKVFLSFDVSVFDCNSPTTLQLFQTYVNAYANHTAAAKFSGKTVLSTFSGESCTFGQGSVNAGWQAVMGQWRSMIYYMPAYTTADGPRSLSTFDIDSQVNWGSAWPNGGTDLTTDNDNYWMSFVPKRYVATVSPLFFSHFPWKNWVHRSDGFLMAHRWEMLLGMRDQIDQVEIISWNDYGESHYIGPITGDQPPESKVWTMNPNIDHTPFLSLQAFYSAAWKTGSFPAITQDKAWLMARPHAKTASASGDAVAVPDGWDYTDDNAYAQVHLTSDASIVFTTSSSAKPITIAGKAGINRMSVPLEAGQGIRLQVVRGGTTSVDLKPDWTYGSSTVRYNFNYWVWTN